VNTEKPRVTAFTRRGALFSRGPRALKPTNSAFLAAMFAVDLLALAL
jgi:hypothetical protein